ncbi:MAG: cytochrome ubiquinol oxidase subunit I [Desulfarculus sp.]|nr:cytochrome ubiquinol oxidase subunit I [Desulfarculus sp.]
MNYPYWELTTWGGGFFIALIAVVHVYVAHFAVGGGLFLVLTEARGHRLKDQGLLDYTRRHTKFFLLLTMVFGGLTGVAIWLTISLLHPAATSILIHTFVFAWATEWVCFVAEIVALFVYYYTFGKMEPRRHLMIGWLYFIFAWLSLVIIGGIIAFMLTSGGWPASGDFWDGFLNPSFVPSVAFRTFLALVLAGVYGLLTATAQADPGLRTRLVRWCAAWLLAPFLLMLATGWWYLAALPDEPRQMILRLNPEMAPVMQTLVLTASALFLGGLALAFRLPRSASQGLALVLLIIGLFYMGSFEWLREAGRRPHIIAGHMYSNSLTPAQMERTQREGLLKLAKWSKIKEVSEDNRQAAGRELYNLLCSPCHSLGGPMNNLLARTAKYGLVGLDSQLDGMGKLLGYMPPFAGNLEERRALAAFIALGLHGKTAKPAAYQPPQMPTPAPAFDAAQDEYLLLAWPQRNLAAFSDALPAWVLLPPGNGLRALLIQRGEAPQIVGEGVEISHRLEQGQSTLAGVLAWQVEGKSHGANGLAASPYPPAGGFNPYPLVELKAKDQKTGRVLAATSAVLPTSSEMGCKNCHGGGWRREGLAGVAPATAQDVLAVHDRINRTKLADQAKSGQPVRCAQCHADPAQAAPGDGQRLSLSAAMHGFHANYLTKRGEEACGYCHPSDPAGATRAYRGLHLEMGLGCTDCHGFLEDHALGLLKGQADKPRAAALMAHLRPRAGLSLQEIKPRQPWQSLPDCLACHQDYAAPTANSAFNAWVDKPGDLFAARGDQAGVRCAACHGPAHALYPAVNPYGPGRDVIQPRQYQGNALPLGAAKNCKVCHTVDMDSEAHHPNSLRPVRSLPAEGP